MEIRNEPPGPETMMKTSLYARVLLLAGCVSLARMAGAATGYDEQSFFQLLMQHRTAAALQSVLGPPAGTESHGDVEILLYEIPVTAGDTVAYPAVQVSGDRPLNVMYLSAEEMQARLHAARLRAGAGERPTGEGQTWSPAEIVALSRHRTAEEVRQAFGPPSRIWQYQGKEAWTYRALSDTPEGPQDQHFLFEFGRVQYGWSGPAPAATEGSSSPAAQE